LSFFGGGKRKGFPGKGVRLTRPGREEKKISWLNKGGDESARRRFYFPTIKGEKGEARGPSGVKAREGIRGK